jgi:hypothetical protein
MGGEERVKRVMALSAGLRATVEAGIRRRHPEYTAEEVQWAWMRMTLGEDLFHKACPGVEVWP